MFDSIVNYQAPADLLKERIILVTGSSEGIGRAAAKTFAHHGATVILHGRDQARLESLYDEIVAEQLAEPAIVTLDLAEATYDDIVVLQNSIGETFGRLDGLLHNAGMLARRNSIASTNSKDWHTVMQVNVNAPFMLTKAMMPLLQESDHPSVVFTSSSVGRKGRAYWGSYAVSKFAIEGLMQVLADEMENISTIRFNSINPGATQTTMRRMAYPGEAAGTNPLPEQIMPAYLYLMGKDSIGVNGQALNAQASAADKS